MAVAGLPAMVNLYRTFANGHESICAVAAGAHLDHTTAALAAPAW